MDQLTCWRALGGSTRSISNEHMVHMRCSQYSTWLQLRASETAFSTQSSPHKMSEGDSPSSGDSIAHTLSLRVRILR